MGNKATLFFLFLLSSPIFIPSSARSTTISAKTSEFGGNNNNLSEQNTTIHEQPHYGDPGPLTSAPSLDCRWNCFWRCCTSKNSKKLNDSTKN